MKTIFYKKCIVKKCYVDYKYKSIHKPTIKDSDERDGGFYEKYKVYDENLNVTYDDSVVIDGIEYKVDDIKYLDPVNAICVYVSSEEDYIYANYDEVKELLDDNLKEWGLHLETFDEIKEVKRIFGFEDNEKAYDLLVLFNHPSVQINNSLSWYSTYIGSSVYEPYSQPKNRKVFEL